MDGGGCWRLGVDNPLESGQAGACWRGFAHNTLTSGRDFNSTLARFTLKTYTKTALPKHCRSGLRGINSLLNLFMAPVCFAAGLAAVRGDDGMKYGIGETPIPPPSGPTQWLFQKPSSDPLVLTSSLHFPKSFAAFPTPLPVCPSASSSRALDTANHPLVSGSHSSAASASVRIFPRR